MGRKYLTIMAVLACGSSAFAQQNDQHAATGQERMIEGYFALKQATFKSIRLVYLGVGCKVTRPAANEMRSFLLKPIEDQRASPLSLIPSIGKDDIDSMARRAEEEGLAKAQESGACEWLVERPEIIRNLRQLEQSYMCYKILQLYR